MPAANLPRQLALACLLSGAAAAQAQNLPTLGEVVVTATRTPHPIAEVPVETLVIDRAEIERSGARALPQLLRSVPGAAATNLDDVIGSDNLRLTLRGLQLNEGYGLILVDGRRVHGGMGAHGDYGISLNQIPLAMIERVEVVKGAGSALYGADAMAGVINIITRRPDSGAGGSASVSVGRYGMTKRQGVAANDRSRESLLVNASYGASLGGGGDALLTLAREQDEGNAQDAQKTWRDSVAVRVAHRLDEAWSAEVQLDLAQARRNALVPTARHDRKYDDMRVAIAIDRQVAEHHLRVSANRFTQDFETGFAGFAHGFRYGEVGFDQIEAAYTHYGDTRWLTVGGEFQRQRLDYLFKNYPTAQPLETVKVKRNIDTASLYVQNEMFLLDERLTLVPGLRVENHSRYGNSVSPRLAASLLTERTGTWRASIGTAFKSPTIRQLYYDGPYRHGSNYDESNPNLKAEKAVNLNLGWERNWVHGGLWSAVTLHHTRVRDKVVRADTGRFIDGLPVRSYQNLDRVRISGVEVAFRAGGRTGFALAAAAAWTRARDGDTGKRMPYVPEQTLTLTPSYVFASGRGGAQLTVSAYGRQYRDAANTQRNRSHSVADLRLWHVLGDHARASLEINNLTNSSKGESEYTWRTGRYVGISLNASF